MSQNNIIKKDEFSKGAVANKLRELISSVLKEELEDENWLKVLESLTEAHETLTKFATGTISTRIKELKDEAGNTSMHFIASPISGIANAIASPVRYVSDDGVDIVAEANFANQYEGPPTCVHGGIIAAVFDEVLGAANSRHGRPGLTGTLKIKYKAPTPLNKNLIIKSRVKEITERKVLTQGEIYHEGLLTAKAEALFISVDIEKFLSIAKNHAGDGIADILKQQWGTSS